MSNRIFYVGAVGEHQRFTGYVPAKFLTRKGMYVRDPTPGGSQHFFIYSGPSGSDKAIGSVANPNNYLIVPANYTEQKARDFAAGIKKIWDADLPGSHIVAGLAMAKAFTQGGSQDLQRHPQWGIPKGSTVKAFVGSASNHLGFITGHADLPKEWSRLGGGVANTINGDVQAFNKLVNRKYTDIDTSGPYGLSRQNDANITQGYADGVAASKTPAPFEAASKAQVPFDDYGYNPQAERQAGQIGDGRGIAGLIASLAGIDPQEPTPPVWPPQADRPIRYLGRVQ